MMTGSTQRWLDTAVSDVKRCLRVLSSRWGGKINRDPVPIPACLSRSCSPSRRCILRIMILLLSFSLFVTVFHLSVLPAATGSYNDDCYLTQGRLERMHYVLRHVLPFLNEENVTYWLDYGTLLGAIRDGDIIPHDGDIDVSRIADDPEKDEKMVSRLKDKMKVFGIEVNVSAAFYEDVKMDLFRWKSFNSSSGETLLRKYYGYVRGTFITESIANYLFPPYTDPKILLPLREMSVFGVTAKIPNRILDFLKSRFPLTWTYSSVPFKWKCYVKA